jgi:predicted metal-dependent hydrolase
MPIPKKSPHWPPPFTLKKSKRVRFVKLKASVHAGLELVVPLRFNQKYIPKILEANKEWIIKQLDKIQLERDNISNAAMPEEIAFPALGQIWKISYITSNNKKLQLLSRPHKELVLLGNITNRSACEKLLLGWVKKMARTHLPELLEEISEEIGLRFSSVNIRSQRTRWGSCTTTKVINLNFKLLFLPAHLTKHIMLHELCHTRHMNHSPRFWRLVASFDPDWEKYSHETRAADQFLPLWAVNIF